MYSKGELEEIISDYIAEVPYLSDAHRSQAIQNLTNEINDLIFSLPWQYINPHANLGSAGLRGLTTQDKLTEHQDRVVYLNHVLRCILFLSMMGKGKTIFSNKQRRMLIEMEGKVHDELTDSRYRVKCYQQLVEEEKEKADEERTGE